MVHVLTCVECGREQAADDRGLKAYLTNDEEEPAEALTEALTYCPERAEEEFGAAGATHAAGASYALLGEIAGLSRQRVAQIMEGE